MKTRIFTSFLWLAMVLVMAGCDMQKSKIAAEVKKLNEECPKPIAAGMTLTSVEIEGDLVVYTMKVDHATYQQVAANTTSPEATKLLSSVIIEGLDNDEKQALVESNMGMKSVYVCETGGSKSIVVSSQEFAQAVKHPIKGEEFLQLNVKVCKSGLPMDIGGGMKMVDISIANGNLRCVIDITQSGLTMDEVQQSLSMIHAKDLLTKESIESDMLLQTTIQQGYNLLYVYTISGSTATCENLFPNRELRAILSD